MLWHLCSILKINCEEIKDLDLKFGVERPAKDGTDNNIEQFVSIHCLMKTSAYRHKYCERYIEKIHPFQKVYPRLCSFDSFYYLKPML